jgi:hypothetical protein
VAEVTAEDKETHPSFAVLGLCISEPIGQNLATALVLPLGSVVSNGGGELN